MGDKSQIDVIRVRSALLGELVMEKNSQFSSAIENLKKFEGYSLGAKDVSEKIIAYVKAQRGEISSLASQQKMHPEIAKFASAVLDKIVAASRVASSEGEKLLFTKQGEIVSIKQEAEKLAALKAVHDKKIKELESAKEDNVEEKRVEQHSSSQENHANHKEEVSTKKRGPKPRPDKNPNTKIGRAAMDVMERRRKKQS